MGVATRLGSFAFFVGLCPSDDGAPMMLPRRGSRCSRETRSGRARGRAAASTRRVVPSRLGLAGVAVKALYGRTGAIAAGAAAIDAAVRGFGVVAGSRSTSAGAAARASALDSSGLYCVGSTIRHRC